MSTMKKVIITLPTKNLLKNNNSLTSTPKIVTSTGTVKLSSYATPVRLDKIKIENDVENKIKLQTVKHMERVSTPVQDVIKKENLMTQSTFVPVRGKKRKLDHLSWEEKLQRK